MLNAGAHDHITMKRRKKLVGKVFPFPLKEQVVWKETAALKPKPSRNFLLNSRRKEGSVNMLGIVENPNSYRRVGGAFFYFFCHPDFLKP